MLKNTFGSVAGRFLCVSLRSYKHSDCYYQGSLAQHSALCRSWLPGSFITERGTSGPILNERGTSGPIITERGTSGPTAHVGTAAPCMVSAPEHRCRATARCPPVVATCDFLALRGAVSVFMICFSLYCVMIIQIHVIASFCLQILPTKKFLKTNYTSTLC